MLRVAYALMAAGALMFGAADVSVRRLLWRLRRLQQSSPELSPPRRVALSHRLVRAGAGILRRPLRSYRTSSYDDDDYGYEGSSYRTRSCDDDCGSGYGHSYRSYDDDDYGYGRSYSSGYGYGRPYYGGYGHRSYYTGYGYRRPYYAGYGYGYGYGGYGYRGYGGGYGYSGYDGDYGYRGYGGGYGYDDGGYGWGGYGYRGYGSYPRGGGALSPLPACLVAGGRTGAGGG